MENKLSKCCGEKGTNELNATKKIIEFKCSKCFKPFEPKDPIKIYTFPKTDTSLYTQEQVDKILEEQKEKMVKEIEGMPLKYENHNDDAVTRNHVDNYKKTINEVITKIKQTI